jgi:hypothetical protein
MKSKHSQQSPSSNAVSRLQLQLPGHRNQPSTSNIKELRLKLRIMQDVCLQSVSIKVHTICNRVLIVVQASHMPSNEAHLFDTFPSVAVVSTSNSMQCGVPVLFYMSGRRVHFLTKAKHFHCQGM